MSKPFETMYDGGEEEVEEEVNQDLGEEQNSNDEGSEEEEKEGQEYLELMGNKYSLDDDGKSKLISDIKGLETSYHDTRREISELRDLISEDQKEEEDDKDDYPIDTESLSQEDQQTLQVLQNLISTQTEKQINKALGPILDKQMGREVKEELNQLESQYGKFDQDELLRYAHKNHLEENLVAAYRDMNFDKQIGKGRKLEASDSQRKKSGSLPGGKTSGKSKTVNYDKEKHGKMSIRELLDLAMED